MRHISTGSAGDCFFGPQMQEWIDPIHKEFGEDMSVLKWIRSGTQPPSGACVPPEGIQMTVDPNPSYVPGFSFPEQCIGANNCYQDFKLVLAGTMALLAASTLVLTFLVARWRPKEKKPLKL